MKKVFLSITLLTLFNSLLAQHHDWCGSDELLQQQLQEDPEFAREFQRSNELINQGPAQPEDVQANPDIIPVVVHVVYANESDNISRSQVEDAIRVLNEDFRRLNSDTGDTRNIFRGVAGDMDIEFRLARKDPNGDCTDGITRTQSSQSLQGNNSVKNLIHWDNDRYLNIWVTRNVGGTQRGSGSVILGFASFPRAGSQNFLQDGAVVRHDEMGTIGTSVSNGRTLTHEVGHYLALFHPFESSGSGSGCTVGDQVNDTPPVDQPSFGCPLGANTCSNDSPDLPDQVENYMDYADCQNMFTNGQRARMKSVLSQARFRSNLVSTANLDFTGITNPPSCVPEADFLEDKRVACVGEPVTFSDNSGVGEPQSWHWEFEAGSPMTDTTQNPTVTFTRAGTHKVKLMVTNAAGSDSIVREDYIYIKNSTEPFFDKEWVTSFELPEVPFHTSLLSGASANDFELTTDAASNGDQSLRLKNGPERAGAVSEIITPLVAVDGAQDLNLFFDFAFAKNRNANSDQLDVFVSTDCGENWNRRRFYNNTRLTTGPLSTGPFVPNANQWQTEVINLDAFIGDDPILVKFSFQHGGGKDFYLDWIRLGEGQDVSLEEVKAETKFQVFPNPASDLVKLKLEGYSDGDVELEIQNITGQPVHSEILSVRDGRADAELRLGHLPAGVYMVHISGREGNAVRKLRLN